MKDTAAGRSKVVIVGAGIGGLSAHLAAAEPWAAEKLAVIDFETTGLSAEQDRVIEVGVACFERGELTALKNWMCTPGIPIPEEARAIHNISDEDLASAPTFAEVVSELEALIRGHLPVAYNAPFDRGFLHAELARARRARATPSTGESEAPAFIDDVT